MYSARQSQLCLCRCSKIAASPTDAPRSGASLGESRRSRLEGHGLELRNAVEPGREERVAVDQLAAQPLVELLALEAHVVLQAEDLAVKLSVSTNGLMTKIR